MTREELHKSLVYHYNTGDWYWISDNSNNVKKGDEAGRIDSKGYRVIGINGKQYKAHRLAFLYMTGKMPPEEVDHINGVRDDNRWFNLRTATSTQNKLNPQGPIRSNTGIRGVSKTQNGYRIALGGHKSASRANLNDAIKIRNEYERSAGWD